MKLKGIIEWAGGDRLKIKLIDYEGKAKAPEHIKGKLVRLNVRVNSSGK